MKDERRRTMDEETMDDGRKDEGRLSKRRVPRPSERSERSSFVPHFFLGALL